MPWISATLGDQFASQLAKAAAAVAELQAMLDKLTPLETFINDNLNNAQSKLTAALALMSDLEQEGVYNIIMSPAEGSWSSRLLSAPNAPNNDTGLYSGVVCTIITAPGISPVQTAFNNMKNSLQKAFKTPFPVPTPGEQPDFIEETEKEFAIDSWNQVTLGDMFPGAFMTIQNQINNAKKLVAAAQSQKTNYYSAISTIDSALSEAKNTITRLNTTGCYNIVLGPDTGGWMSRLLSEPGVPPTGSSYYCAGMCAVVQAADLAKVSTLFNKLIVVKNG
ncbi:MAG: hypothetical protein ACOX2F_07170 [bacterium]